MIPYIEWKSDTVERHDAMTVTYVSDYHFAINARCSRNNLHPLTFSFPRPGLDTSALAIL